MTDIRAALAQLYRDLAAIHLRRAFSTGLTAGERVDALIDALRCHLLATAHARREPARTTWCVDEVRA